jgi:hypothetical protein
MNNVRIERMLRELHAGPPLGFFEDIFALRDIVASLMAEIREPGDTEPIAEPTLASVAGGASPR